MIKLSKIPTVAPTNVNEEKIRDRTKELTRKIADLHETLIAEGKHSLLVVFQGMDSSGKDGATKNVFKRCSPTGISVTAFKKPSKEELAHDFLWRVHQHAPSKGTIKIFNRSHYEDILIQRVHGWINLATVKRRMAAINTFEELLQFDNNTTVLKFYMHLSKKRQTEKLQERIDDPDKNWKHNPGDWEEAKLWRKYRNAYEYAINNSSIPWHIVPVDQRWYRDYVIAEKIATTLEGLKMKRPVLKK